MARTITHPANNSDLDSSVIRGELQTLETEIADTTLGHNHDGTNSKLITIPSFSDVWPVGSVYINASVNTNPATLLGFGTWSAIASGRVLVGVDTEQSEFETLNKTGGAKTHQLSTAEMAQHNHAVDPPNTTTGGQSQTHYHAVMGRVLNMVSGSDSPARELGTSATPNRNDGQTEAADRDHTHNVDIPSFNSGNAGSNTAHNNLQPYLTVYMWVRTA